MKSPSIIKQRLSERREILTSILDDAELEHVVELVSSKLLFCIQHGGKILTAGNGGSAAQAEHFCSELMGRFKDKRSPVQAMSLCSNVSLLTCISNDFGYERVFSRQIEGIGNGKDIFVAFTTSGHSRNIIEALHECKSQGICTVAFSGKETDMISKFANHVISIPTEDTAIIQEAHLQIVHIICEIIENTLNDNGKVWHDVLDFGHQGYTNLILDRDGVINHVKANEYINSFAEFIFRKDFLAHAKELSETFSYIFVVSNQKGVGKGLISLHDLNVVHNRMKDELLRVGGRIDHIYIGTNARNDAPENKPNTGMAELIRRDYPDIDFSKTIVVGDSASDHLFADKLNCKFIYVRTR